MLLVIFRKSIIKANQLEWSEKRTENKMNIHPNA
jgi:hypothetical protein